MNLFLQVLCVAGGWSLRLLFEPQGGLPVLSVLDLMGTGQGHTERERRPQKAAIANRGVPSLCCFVCRCTKKRGGTCTKPRYRPHSSSSRSSSGGRRIDARRGARTEQ